MLTLARFLARTASRSLGVATVLGLVSGVCGAGFVMVVNESLTGGSISWLVFAVVCAALVVTRFVAQSLMYRVAQTSIVALRQGLVADIVAAPLRRVEQVGVARLLSALSDDTVTISAAVPGIPQLISGVAMLVATMAYLTWVSRLIAATAFAAVVLGVGLYLLFARSGSRALLAARTLQDDLFDQLRAITSGLKEIKLDRVRRRAVRADLRGLSHRHRDASVRGLTIFELAGDAGQAVFLGLIGVVVFSLPSLFTIAPGALAGSVLVLLFTVSSLQSVLAWLPACGKAGVALNAVHSLSAELRVASEDLVSTSGDRVAPVLGEPVVYERITHAYSGPRGESFELGPLDLRLVPGEVVVIAGANGSGKTTLGKLITGLYPPKSGTIRVGSTPVDMHNRDDFRQRFAAVFTDFFLFDDVLVDAQASTVDDIESGLAGLQLDHKVALVDGRWSTTDLSTGQRKRLALLSAYLLDRPVYVFDEWAADQDPLFKQYFYLELVPRLRSRGKSVVLISHDDRYFAVANRIFHLEDGRVVEAVCS